MILVDQAAERTTMSGRRTDEPVEPRFDGVFVGGRSGGIGLPRVRNLSQEYRDTPEPEDSDRVPPPAPRSTWARLMDRIRGSRPAG
jgi:hypothetical protein